MAGKEGDLISIDVQELYDTLLPTHIGNELCKQILAMQMFTIPKFREKLHILLVGSTGVDKSGFLIEVSKIMPRAGYCGRNTTRCGLNETMVANSNGVVCVDEADKLPRDTLNALLEAMQQQTVSIATHRLHAQLEAKVNILAACNPVHSELEVDVPLINQLPFAPELLARFHMIIPMETLDKDAYEKIGANLVTNGDGSKEHERRMRLRELIANVKDRYERVFISEAIGRESGKFCGFLKENSRLKEAITPRLIEGFLASVKAFARMQKHKEATDDDLNGVKWLYWKIYGDGY